MSSYILVLIMSIIGAGLGIVLTTRNLLKMVVGINFMELGVNLLLIFIGFRPGSTFPILSARDQIIKAVDPLPQALVLTAIVIGFATTAFVLVLALIYRRRTGSYLLKKSIYRKMKEDAVVK